MSRNKSARREKIWKNYTARTTKSGSLADLEEILEMYENKWHSSRDHNESDKSQVIVFATKRNIVQFSVVFRWKV